MPASIIESYDPSALDDFRSLRGKSLRGTTNVNAQGTGSAGYFENGLFIAEGPKVTQKFLESGYDIPMAFLTPEHFARLRPAFERRTGGTSVYLAEKAEMEGVVGYPLHQGVMLAVRMPEGRGLEAAAAEWGPRVCIVALDSIADAENMGAILRNAAAFGAAAVLMDGQSCSPYLRRSVRVSMGFIVDVEILPVPDLAAALEWLGREQQFRIIGAALSERSRDLQDADVSGRDVIVFGSEGWGLRPRVAAACDTLLQIPISPKVDSLNVAIASGIFLHHFATVQ